MSGGAAGFVGAAVYPMGMLTVAADGSAWWHCALCSRGIQAEQVASAVAIAVGHLAAEHIPGLAGPVDTEAGQ